MRGPPRTGFLPLWCQGEWGHLKVTPGDNGPSRKVLEMPRAGPGQPDAGRERVGRVPTRPIC